MAKATIHLITENGAAHGGSAQPGSATQDRSGQDARLATAFRDLETEVCEILSMARIVVDQVDAIIGDDPNSVTGRSDLFWVPESRRDSTIFAAGHLLSMIAALKDAYYAAYPGPGPEAGRT